VTRSYASDVLRRVPAIVSSPAQGNRRVVAEFVSIRQLTAADAPIIAIVQVLRSTMRSSLLRGAHWRSAHPTSRDS